MIQPTYDRKVPSIRGIADDDQRDLSVRGEFHNGTLPIAALRRLDAGLVLNRITSPNKAKTIDQALRQATRQTSMEEEAERLLEDIVGGKT